MITIHQAIFGYSNGHHLISSSDSFENKTLNILEKTSDLVGSSVFEDFDGYLTGYLLSEKKVYVLSKTWFANEMPRPGCVWTHSLFIPLEITDSQLKGINFDSIFHRPDISDLEWNDYYSKPIQIMNANKEIISENNDKPQYYYDLVSILIGSSTPTVIVASSCVEYNCIFEEMIKDMGMSFIKDISFCTGSFALRSLSDSLFLIQVVPQKFPRGNWRSNVAVQMVYETSDKSLDFKNNYSMLDIITATSFLTKKCKIKIEKGRMKYILDLFLALRDKNIALSIKSIFFNGLTIFGKDYPVEQVLSEVFKYKLTNDYVDEQLLIEFCTLDTEKFKLKEDFYVEILNSVANIIFSHDYSLVLLIFRQLISAPLNKFGEILINLFASKADAVLVNYFIDVSDSMSLKAILSLNYKLALNCKIWTSPVETQCDVIKILSNYYLADDDKNECFYADIITLIYNTSQFDLSIRIYESFKNLAIKVFFLWITSKEIEAANISKWCKICRFDSLYSVQLLNEFDVKELEFEHIINVLDPYNQDLLAISTDIWETFYRKFCNVNAYSINKSYAQFILPIILMSKQDFPTELVEFAFSTMHSILARNEMEYARWEDLSKILPEVPLYSMWDRCKRLRKAGKIKNIKIDLKKYK
ncbi:MAG: hypothetical protein OSJ43_07795 [Oscillospiraceae bacterium]|nr:hypothetical protein [Oscillospiraceae bacterium]